MQSLRARGRRASRVALPVSAAVIVILWLATLFASDAPWFIITLFWLGVGGAIAFWVGRDMRQHARGFERASRDLESALRRNAADVYDIRARAFAEFEEVEDEGACYAFELDGHRLVFLIGQEFYDSARFPSLDFSLVYVLDEQGQSVDMLIDKRGLKAAPTRTIPAAAKLTFEIPEHLETRSGTVAEIEANLNPAPGSASRRE